MNKLVYTFTLSMAMIVSLASGSAKSGHADAGEKACEATCEAKKEQCEKLKPDTAKFNACVAQVQKDCQQVCKNGADKDRDDDHDNN